MDFLPKILTLDGRGFDTTTYSLIYGFALFLSFLGYNFYGWLSDRRAQDSDPVVLRISRRLRGSRLTTCSIMRPERNIWMAVLGTVWRAC